MGSEKVALVTGGARGLGLAIVKRYVQDPMISAVYILDSNKDTLQKCIKENFKDQASVKTICCDVTDAKQVESAFQTVQDQCGRLDILVNSAGVVGETNLTTEKVRPEDFEFVWRVNVYGMFLCCKYALKIMVKRNTGRILNIASIAGKEGNAGMLSYSTSKAAVIGMTKVIGKEYAETGITCNALAPAVVRTEMVAAMPPEQVKYMTDKIPMKRTGLPEEMANLVHFVTSEQASFTTGFCFDATGGRATY